MGTIKDRNGKDLTESKEIKKRWQEYTEEMYKKALNDPDNHDGVVTYLEPDILDCEVKWTLGSIQFSSVQFSSVIQSCQTLRPHGLQYTRPPCPSPTPRVYSN